MLLPLLLFKFAATHACQPSDASRKRMTLAWQQYSREFHVCQWGGAGCAPLRPPAVHALHISDASRNGYDMNVAWRQYSRIYSRLQMGGRCLPNPPGRGGLRPPRPTRLRENNPDEDLLQEVRIIDLLTHHSYVLQKLLFRRRTFLESV